MNTVTLRKVVIYMFFPVVILLNVFVGLEMAKLARKGGCSCCGIKVINMGDSLWGLIGCITCGGCPCFSVTPGLGSGFIVLYRKVPLGILFHEVAHITYPDARGAMNPEAAHTGKGARFEHQADKWAIRKLVDSGMSSQIPEFIKFLEKAPGDGPYRANLLKRYMRRYSIA